MADQLKLGGVIKLIDDAQQVTDKLTKRQLVLTTTDKYPQDVAFEFINDACDTLDRYAPGMEVDVYFNVRGREWNGKYYTNLSGWKVEAAGGAAPTTAAKPAGQQSTSANRNPNLRAQPAAPIASDDDNDLPF